MCVCVCVLACVLACVNMYKIIYMCACVCVCVRVCVCACFEEMDICYETKTNNTGYRICYNNQLPCYDKMNENTSAPMYSIQIVYSNSRSSS